MNNVKENQKPVLATTKISVTEDSNTDTYIGKQIKMDTINNGHINMLEIIFLKKN